MRYKRATQGSAAGGFGYYCVLTIAATLAAPLLAVEEPTVQPANSKYQFSLEQQHRLSERDSWSTTISSLIAANKISDALALAEKKLALERDILSGDHAYVVRSLLQLAEIHAQRDNFAAARKMCQDARVVQTRNADSKPWQLTDVRLKLAQLERREKLPPADRQRVAESHRLTLRAKDLGERSKYDEALPLARQALEICISLLGEGDADTLMSLKNLGWMLRDLDQLDEAELLLKKTLKLRERIQGADHPDYAYTWNVLGWVYFRKDPAQAETCFRNALSVYRMAGGEKVEDYSMTLGNLASLCEARADPAGRESFLREIVEVNRQVLGELNSAYAGSLDGLASLYLERGDYVRAEPLYRKSLQICREVGAEKTVVYARCLNSIANLRQCQCDYVQAEILSRQVAEVCRELFGEKDYKYATSLSNLAFVCEKRKNFAEAESLQRNALEIRRQVLGEKHIDIAFSLLNLGRVYANQGAYDQAEPLYLEALAIWEHAQGDKHCDYARCLRSLADLHRCQGNYSKSKPLYLQALEIFRQMLGDQHEAFAGTLDGLALLHGSEGDFAQAERLSRQAFEIVNRYLERSALVQSERQQLIMTASQRAILDNYLSIVVESHQAGDAALQAVLHWKGMIWMRQRQLRAATDEPALAPVFAELQRVSMHLARVAMITPAPSQADAWRRKLAELTERKEEVERQLASQSAAYRAAKREVTTAELLDSLPPEAALVDFLEYSHFNFPTSDTSRPNPRERRYLAFVVRSGQPCEAVDLGPSLPIVEAIEAWRGSFGRSPEAQQAARQLRMNIWEPLEPRLLDAKIVLFSPDGSLGRLPLPALPGKEPGTYLLEEKIVSLLPVPQALPAIMAEEGKKSVAGNLLLVGGVDYDAQPNAVDASAGNSVANRKFGRTKGAPRGTQWRKFLPLDGARGELATIEKMYQAVWPREKMAVLEKGQATEEAFRQESPKFLYLHLASHGFFAPPELLAAFGSSVAEEAAVVASRGNDSGLSDLAGYDPGLLSGIAFAGANHPNVDGDDGILTAEEVSFLDLRGLELATLSACETGLGTVAGGEGLLGLQRAFQTAGARTVIASLWKVDDVATRDLMERFYDNLWNKDMGKLAALREAQLWMLREHGPRGLQPLDGDEQPAKSKRLPPYYWAAFVLSGDWR